MISLLWSHIELVVDALLAAIGAAIGILHAGRIVRKCPNVDLTNVHRYMGRGLHVIAAVLTGVVWLTITGVVRPLAWALPLVVELLFPFLKWGGLIVVFSYLAGLSLRVAWHSHHRERGKLTLALVLLIMALLILRWNTNYPIPASDYDVSIAEGGIVLQTTGASCVPATIANILGRLGYVETEGHLAVEMGTTGSGTTHGRVALALWRRGFCCRRVTAGSVAQVKPPAALTVDHAIGPESHMVALMGVNEGVAEIWDPLHGRVMMDFEMLSTIWHGKALEVYRP